MESSPKIGCIIRNKNDPYQMQCVFSTDPKDTRDFSVYFHSPDGKQEIMASCTYDEGYECIFARESLSLTGDYITVSETFSAQNGSFVCRNGGPALEQFPCFYSGKSVKPEVKGGMTDNGSNTLHNPGYFGTEDNDPAVIIGAVCGVVIILQFILIGFLLFKIYKARKDRQKLKWFIGDSEQTRSEKELLGLNIRNNEQARSEKELLGMNIRNSEQARSEKELLGMNISDMTDSSISIVSGCISEEENEAIDTIETPAELRDYKV